MFGMTVYALLFCDGTNLVLVPCINLALHVYGMYSSITTILEDESGHGITSEQPTCPPKLFVSGVIFKPTFVVLSWYSSQVKAPRASSQKILHKSREVNEQAFTRYSIVFICLSENWIVYNV